MLYPAMGQPAKAYGLWLVVRPCNQSSITLGISLTCYILCIPSERKYSETLPRLTPCLSLGKQQKDKLKTNPQSRPLAVKKSHASWHKVISLACYAYAMCNVTWHTVHMRTMFNGIQHLKVAAGVSFISLWEKTTSYEDFVQSWTFVLENAVLSY